MEQLALEIAHWQILDMQLKKLTEGEFVSVHEESRYDEKDEDVLEEVIPIKSKTQQNKIAIKGTLENIS